MGRTIKSILGLIAETSGISVIVELYNPVNSRSRCLRSVRHVSKDDDVTIRRVVRRNKNGSSKISGTVTAEVLVRLLMGSDVIGNGVPSKLTMITSS